MEDQWGWHHSGGVVDGSGGTGGSEVTGGEEQKDWAVIEKKMVVKWSDYGGRVLRLPNLSSLMCMVGCVSLVASPSAVYFTPTAQLQAHEQLSVASQTQSTKSPWQQNVTHTLRAKYTMVTWAVCHLENMQESDFG
jgi:hypothetical protein